jgi:hypothetical protein
LVLFSLHASAQAEQDTMANEKKPVALNPGRQLSIGFDLMGPVLNRLVSNRYGLEGAVDYYLKNEYYAVLEGGAGRSEVNYTDLRYTTNNYFVRAGFNKNILSRESNHDWDMMFAGLRAGFAGINRSEANYVVADSLWGIIEGVSAAKSFPALWLELNLGMRVELYKSIMAGWNVRSKFIMNGKSFRDLQPLYISGFGRGDKNAVFDFNLYLCYAIRWNRA